MTIAPAGGLPINILGMVHFLLGIGLHFELPQEIGCLQR